MYDPWGQVGVAIDQHRLVEGSPRCMWGRRGKTLRRIYAPVETVSSVFSGTGGGALVCLDQKRSATTTITNVGLHHQLFPDGRSLYVDSKASEQKVGTQKRRKGLQTEGETRGKSFLQDWFVQPGISGEKLAKGRGVGRGIFLISGWQDQEINPMSCFRPAS